MPRFTFSYVAGLTLDVTDDRNSIGELAEGMEWMVKNLVEHMFGAVYEANAEVSQGRKLRAKHFVG